MLTIYPTEINEDLEIVKGLLERYLASMRGLEGPVHSKEVEAHKHQVNNLGECFRPPEECLLVAKYKNEPAGCVAPRAEQYKIDFKQMAGESPDGGLNCTSHYFI